jgi:hypothetical protein
VARPGIVTEKLVPEVLLVNFVSVVLGFSFLLQQIPFDVILSEAASMVPPQTAVVRLIEVTSFVVRTGAGIGSFLQL